MRNYSKNFFLISFFLFVNAFSCFSKQISEEQSMDIAKQFYMELKASNQGCSQPKNVQTAIGAVSQQNLRLAYCCRSNPTRKSARTSASSLEDTTSTCYYVYNVGDESGFILVSGDDQTKPILGYSTEGSFSIKNMPENVRSFLGNYQNQIENILLDNSSTGIQKAMSINKNDSAVSPLISTKWGQEVPFNSKIPITAPTGCGATAMAQVMNYFEWPKTGISSKSYTYNGSTFAANFASTTYDWANMKDEYDINCNPETDSSKAVATLMYHCGVALTMRYAADVSATEANNIPKALVNFFGYDQNIKYVPGSDYTPEQWKYIVKTELNEKRPVLAFGSDSNAIGHEFIADGYDKYDFIHINWGWDGAYNGFFETDPLDGSIYYTPGSLIIGIQKPVESTENKLLYDGLDITCNTKLDKNISYKFKINVYERNYNSFSGYAGVAIYSFDRMVSIIDSTKRSFPAGYYSYFEQKITFPTSLKNGIYRLVPIYRNSNGVWKEMEFWGNYDTDKRNSRNYEFVVSSDGVIVYENSKTMVCNNKGDFRANFTNYDWFGIERLVISGPIDQFDLLYMGSVQNIKSINLENARILDTKISDNEVAYGPRPDSFEEFINNLSSKWKNYVDYFWHGKNYYEGNSKWIPVKFYIGETPFNYNVFYSTESGLYYDAEQKIYLTNSEFNKHFVKKDNYVEIKSDLNYEGYSRTQENIQIIGSLGSTFIIGKNGIMAEAFLNSKVENIILPNNLKYIAPMAFANCPNLNSISLPDSVCLIGDSLFFNCPKLTSVKFNSTLKSAWNQDFSKSASLSTVILPDSLCSIPNNMFKNCTSLSNISIPASVKAIGDSAFANCTSLFSIYIYCPTPVDLSDALHIFGNVDVKNCKLYVPVGSKALYQNAIVWKDFFNMVEFTETGFTTPISQDVDVYFDRRADELRIKGIDGSCYITVCDLTGRIYFRSKYIDNHSASLQNIPDGVYLITIEKNKNRITKKIVK